jgi:hypothetical protein
MGLSSPREECTAWEWGDARKFSGKAPGVSEGELRSDFGLLVSGNHGFEYNGKIADFVVD